ncbi:hypothetical protein ACVGVM_02540 [Pseudonocardia bannensis]|uniref:Uncharacterized protein n=1 Tax=Pseudonocardia bannensis TaxID=630973 RepID=A0A848DH17_9PSEU|nr:hypothetical protein [Pseudonocardia bannensis]NMH91972.1 hypothetical protein [Pseudonocardia bannensis]
MNAANVGTEKPSHSGRRIALVAGVGCLVVVLIGGLLWQKVSLDSAAEDFRETADEYVTSLRDKRDQELVEATAHPPELPEKLLAFLSEDYQKARLRDVTLREGVRFVHDLEASTEAIPGVTSADDDLSENLYYLQGIFYYATAGAIQDRFIELVDGDYLSSSDNSTDEKRNEILNPVNRKVLEGLSAAATEYITSVEKIRGTHDLYAGHAARHLEEVKKYKSMAEECLVGFARFAPTEDTTDFYKGCVDSLNAQNAQILRPYSYIVYLPGFVKSHDLTTVALDQLTEALKTSERGAGAADQRFLAYIGARMAIAKSLLPKATSDEHFAGKADVLRVMLSDARTELDHAGIGAEAATAIDDALHDAEVTMTLYDNPADLDRTTTFTRVVGAGGFMTRLFEVATKPIDYAEYRESKSYTTSFAKTKEYMDEVEVPEFLSAEVGDVLESLKLQEEAYARMDTARGDARDAAAAERDVAVEQTKKSLEAVAQKIDDEYAADFRGMNASLSGQLDAVVAATIAATTA